MKALLIKIKLLIDNVPFIKKKLLAVLNKFPKVKKKLKNIVSFHNLPQAAHSNPETVEFIELSAHTEYIYKYLKTERRGE
jgi:hypothetical protein